MFVHVQKPLKNQGFFFIFKLTVYSIGSASRVTLKEACEIITLLGIKFDTGVEAPTVY